MTGSLNRPLTVCFPRTDGCALGAKRGRRRCRLLQRLLSLVVCRAVFELAEPSTMIAPLAIAATVQVSAHGSRLHSTLFRLFSRGPNSANNLFFGVRLRKLPLKFADVDHLYSA